jgi:hypothetical protein
MGRQRKGTMAEKNGKLYARIQFVDEVERKRDILFPRITLIVRPDSSGWTDIQLSDKLLLRVCITDES